MRDVKTFLANLPHHPGVYQMLDANRRVIYVGKAKDLKKRVASYFSGKAKDLKTLSLLKHVDDMDITITRNENEAVLLECNLIKKCMPKYNVLLRDDKSYPYIVITNDHPYPRIDAYRGIKKKDHRYFGPYPNAIAVRETIHLLQKLFQLRTCSDDVYKNRYRPCLQHQIGRCAGPCVGLISEADYQANIQRAVLFLQGKSDELIQELQTQMEAASAALNYERAMHLRDQIARLRQIQDQQYVSGAAGNADILGLAVQAGVIAIQLLVIRDGRVLGSRSYFPAVPQHANDNEIITAFLEQHYLSMPSDALPKEIIVQSTLKDQAWLVSVLSERAQHKLTILMPKWGEKKKWLDMAVNSAKQSLAVHRYQKTNLKERLSGLKVALGLTTSLQRIECFDISHSLGEATVASCVVFDENGPLKSHYRRFNIAGITPGDDTAAMEQVVLRRFKRLQQEGAVLPEVILIDGGKPQLHAAQKAMMTLKIEKILLVGVSKGEGRKPGYETLHFLDRPPMHLPADSHALHFIQQIRDEAHRFAITAHRARRDKARTHSVLETISGVGAKRRRDLLRYFGGLQGLSHASLDEIMKVPGISRSLAERIFARLHDAT